MRAAASPSPATLRRVLGPVEVTASGVGIIIGAGIYVLLGAATAEAGPAVWASFAIAAVLCGITGLSYAELASMFPSAGAEYDYTRRALPEAIAFAVGWMMSLGLMVATAAIAIGFAQYLDYFVGVPIPVAAIALLVVECGIALTGIRRSSRLTVALSALQVVGLLAVVAVGLPAVGSTSLIAGSSAGDVLGGAALVFFAFIGFDEVITLAEETRNPTKVIPRALLVALGLSAALYMAVAVAAVSVLGASAVGGSSRPLADVMARAVGGQAESGVAAVALLTTVNTSLLAMTAGSRLLYGMASHGALPKPLCRVSPNSGVPAVAVVATAGAAVAFASLGDLTFVASVTDFAVYAVFIAVNVTVIVLRYRAPSMVRPFRSPAAVGRLPVGPVLGLAATGAMLPQLDRSALATGAAMLGLGAVLSHSRRFLEARRESSTG